MFLACASLDVCPGGANFTCGRGYLQTAVMCQRCVPGQLLWRGRCSDSCFDNEPERLYGVVTVMGILAVIAVWIIMNKMTAGK